MKNFYNRILNKSLSVFLFLNLSCAIVTINVYFPAEEVKDVFKALEDELLDDTEQEDADTETDVEQESMEEENASDSEQTSFIYPSEPNITTSKIIATKRVFTLIPEVYAASSITSKILNSIKSNPEIQKAYDRRNGRLSAINKILSKRLAGEGNTGLVVARGNLAQGDRDLIEAENSDRTLIIKIMAEEIIKINKLDTTPDNVNSVKPQAAEQFAAVRRDEVKSGTLVQYPDGKWGSR
ncbi:MAG: DUF1318 domain-containing protein [Candidatus Dadabacteria bacterium]|nr:DUF1318 domain-containing protein [Candidatus Dadabacteria bacterium]